MKILLINVVYNIGSTGKIVCSLKEQYEKKGHDVYVAFGRRSSIKNDPKIIKCAYELESKIFHFVSLFSENIYGNMPFSTRRLIRLIRKISPDVVHLHCLNGYFVNVYKLLNFLKKKKINTVLTNHAEFMYTANCGISVNCNKWINNECNNCSRVKNFNGNFSLNRTTHFFKKMKSAFSDFNTLTITNVSPWLTERCKKSPFFKERKIITVLNPVCMTNKKIDENPYEKLKDNMDSKNILFVTASYDNPEKGGFFIPKIAKLLEKEKFHIFVKSAIVPKKTNNLTNLSFINNEIDSTQLAALYRYADITMILSARETFSMVVAESLIQGTPVVGFKAGGPETICLSKYCSFVDYGKIDDLINQIKITAYKTFDKIQIADDAASKYNVETIAHQYLSLYEKNIQC